MRVPFPAKRSHVKLLFREQPWSLVACDDILIAFALRKYAGVRSFVIGIDPKNPDTWGLSPDWRTLGVEKATTVGDMLPVRDMHFWRLLNRGNTFQWMRDEQSKGIRYHLAAFSSLAEAETLYKALGKSVDFDDRTKVLALWCGPRREDARSAVTALGLDMSDQHSHAWSWLDMELGLETDGPFSERLLGSNAVFGIGASDRRPEAGVDLVGSSGRHGSAFGDQDRDVRAPGPGLTSFAPNKGMRRRCGEQRRSSSRLTLPNPQPNRGVFHRQHSRGSCSRERRACLRINP